MTSPFDPTKDVCFQSSSDLEIEVRIVDLCLFKKTCILSLFNEEGSNWFESQDSSNSSITLRFSFSIATTNFSESLMKYMVLDAKLASD